MTLADRILILNRGSVEQFDTPKAIYHRPASVFVAKFIGAPPMNILPVTGDGSVLRLADGQAVAEHHKAGEFQLGIRPEDIAVETGGPIKGRLKHFEDLGSHTVLSADLAGAPVRIATPFGADIDSATELSFSFPRSRLHLFDGETGRAIPDAFATH
jgi:sn-glycerol 3-phosphate transport system ATP-binding protein